MAHQLTVALSANAPRQVRHSFDRHANHIEAALLDDLRLLSSEIVTNAVQHSGRPQGDPITIETAVEPNVVRVAIVDQGDGVHPLRPRSTTPPSGLGYVARLSNRWSSATVNSFQVWFEIDVQSNGLVQRKRA